jgi:hypothetical protein
LVTGVSWRIDDPSVASILPAGESTWVTGSSLGTTSLGARIGFSNGTSLDAQGRGIRVVGTTATVGELVTQGTLTIAPYVPPGTTDNWRGWVPFTTRTAGRIEVRVDWGSPLNRIDFSGYERHCGSIGSCGTIRMTVRATNVKPLTATFDNPVTPAGDYTVRIDNLGPGEETVRYEVRLTPS